MNGQIQQWTNKTMDKYNNGQIQRKTKNTTPSQQ